MVFGFCRRGKFGQYCVLNKINDRNSQGDEGSHLLLLNLQVPARKFYQLRSNAGQTLMSRELFSSSTRWGDRQANRRCRSRSSLSRPWLKIRCSACRGNAIGREGKSEHLLCGCGLKEKMEEMAGIEGLFERELFCWWGFGSTLIQRAATHNWPRRKYRRVNAALPIALREQNLSHLVILHLMLQS